MTQPNVTHDTAMSLRAMRQIDNRYTNLEYRCVVGMMVLVDGVIVGSVVGQEERPPTQVAVVLIARVQKVAMEKERVSWEQRDEEMRSK